MKIRKAPVTILIAFLLLMFLPDIMPTEASPAATMYIDPSSIIDPDMLPSTNLSFLINIANVSDLYAWQIKLYFNPSLLNWTGASYPTGHIFYGRPTAPVSPIKDSDAGGTYILHFLTLTGAVSGFTGSGTLCQLNFTIIDQGVSNLTFSRPLGADTWLWDSNLSDIPFEALDGYINNKSPTPPATLYVDPPKKIDPTLVPSQNFTVNVNIENATILRQLEFKLGFNATLLSVVNATLDSFLPPATIYTIEINNTQGYVKYTARVDSPEPPLNGNGTIGLITFHVESFGFCYLTLTETSLIDDFGDPVSHSTKDGYFNNIMLAKIAVQPPEIKDPSLLPPQTFEINITIAEVEDLYGYEFKLGYDPEVIIALNINISDIFGEVHYVPNFSVDNINGIVWVKVDYYEPANPISTIPPVTAVTITFRVRRIGISVLDLYDTNLSDSSGQPITHEALDGLFISAKRDIALVDIATDKTEAYKGWIVRINVTATNEGDLNETFDVKVYYGNDSLIGTLTFIHVGPNETATLTIQWNTMSVLPCQNYTIWAEAVPLPYEEDLADNLLIDGKVKIWLMGDINHDRKVDGKDFAIASAAFASYPGHPRWDPRADLTQDNKIDGKDLAKIASNFGKTC